MHLLPELVPPSAARNEPVVIAVQTVVEIEAETAVAVDAPAVVAAEVVVAAVPDAEVVVASAAVVADGTKHSLLV